MKHHPLPPHEACRPSRLPCPRSAVALLLALLLLPAPIQPAAAQAQSVGSQPALPSYQAAGTAMARPAVGGAALVPFDVPGVQAFADAAVDAEVLENVRGAIGLSGSIVRHREFDLDGAGLMVASLAPFLLEDVQDVRVRITVPQLGVLGLDPRTDTLARPSAPSVPSRAGPAPVQVPADSRP